MRDSRSLLLLLVSFLLVLVSFGLMWTWGFRFYVKNDEPKQETQKLAADSALLTNRIRDSIQNEYKITLKDLDIQLDSTLFQSDSLKNELDLKLQEFYRLRNEITSIINSRNSNNDLKAAKQKLGELQNKVQDFKEKNNDVADANSKLKEVLVDLTNSKGKTTHTKTNIPEVRNVPESEVNVVSAFTASDIIITALFTGSDKEAETNSADKTNKLTATFAVSNFNSQLTNGEIYVVLLQPNGKVLKNSGWDSGTFFTRDGKKVYSSKFNFSYSRGDVKRLSFSIQTSNLSKGTYSLEVYSNGVLIGRATKTLS